MKISGALTVTQEKKDKVQLLAGFGITEKFIAGELDISVPTLKKKYKHELETGKEKADSMVAQSLFNKATGDGQGAVAAAIFWAKTRMRWRETPTALELSGPDGGAIQVEQVSARELILNKLNSLASRTGEGYDLVEVDGGASAEPPLGLEGMGETKPTSS